MLDGGGDGTLDVLGASGVTALEDGDAARAFDEVDGFPAADLVDVRHDERGSLVPRARPRLHVRCRTRHR